MSTTEVGSETAFPMPPATASRRRKVVSDPTSVVAINILETAAAWLLGVLWVLPLVYALWTAFHAPEYHAHEIPFADSVSPIVFSVCGGRICFVGSAKRGSPAAAGGTRDGWYGG